MADIRGLDFALLLALDALYQERSVTRAADRLALSQPTVSGMLNRLRHVLGDELYVRTSHGVLPTPRAEALAGPVRDIIAATEALFERDAFDPRQSQFDVTLSGTDYVNRTLFHRLAADILKEAPHARVSVLPLPRDPRDHLRVLREVDILCSTHDPIGRPADRLPLFRDRLACVSSYPEHVDGQPMPLETLCDLSHVVLTQFGSSVSIRLAEALRERGLERNITLRVPDFASVFRAMRHGALVAFMPLKMAQQYSGALKTLNVGLEIPVAEVVANWHETFNGDARHAWIRQMVQRSAAALRD